MRTVSLYTFLSTEKRLFCGKRFSLTFNSLVMSADSVIVFHENGINTYIKNRHHYTRDIQLAKWEDIGGKVYVLVSHHDKLFPTTPLGNILYYPKDSKQLFSLLHCIEVDLDLVHPKLRWEYIYALTQLCDMEE